ncbi:MAG: hypothetical protein D6766_00720, partial [Verrucomicrobia bacterium]
MTTDTPTPTPATPTERSVEPGRVAESLRRLARVAAVFCLSLGVLLMAQFLGGQAYDPFKSPQMAELKAQLAKSPKDEALKQQIRELDLRLRQRYFAHLRRTRAGAWMLLIGVAAWVLSAKRARVLTESPHLPRPVEEAAARHLELARRVRRAVLVSGGLVILGLAGLALGTRTHLPRDRAELAALEAAERQGREEQAAAAAPRLPSREEYLANWPRFLGPTGNALSIHTNIPVRWDPETGENILWKAEVPLPGYGSPIVWRDRLFVTGGNAERRAVFCYDVRSGRLLWEQTVPAGPAVTAKQLKGLEQTGFANSSPATDGLRVYAVFATGDLAAYDFDGKLVWIRHLGVPDDPYGHAASLYTHEDRLVLQWDQGSEGDPGSKLMLLDGATGNPVWETERDLGSSWATGTIIQTGDRWQIINVGGAWVLGYNLATGKELWRLECLGGELTPSPIFAGGLVLAVSPSDRLCAMRPDGQGELGEDALVWYGEEEVPDIASPVADEKRVFTIATYGVLVCYDLKTGEKLWDHEVDMECNATPAIVANRM